MIGLLIFQSRDPSASKPRKLVISSLCSQSVQGLGRKLAFSQLGGVSPISARKQMLAVLPAWMLQPARGRRVGQKMEFNPQSKLLPLDQRSLHLCSRDGCLEPWEGMRAVLGLSSTGGRSRAERSALVACGFLTSPSFLPRQNQG